MDKHIYFPPIWDTWSKKRKQVFVLKLLAFQMLIVLCLFNINGLKYHNCYVFIQQILFVVIRIIL